MVISPRFVARAVAGLVLVAAVPAVMAHDEPRRAKSVKAALVTAYEPCTNPNTVVDGPAAFPACSPPTRGDGVCGFQGAFFKAGYAKASGATTPTGDFRLSYVAKGLNAGCEGRRLCAVAQVRVTTDRCVQKPCTFDLPQWYVNSLTGCCTVQSGQCRVGTSINSEMLGTLRQGEKTGIEIVGCGLKRVDGPNLPAGLTFSCGVLAP
jgi:hypothetical protein